MKFKFALIAAVALSLGTGAMAQTKWDLPSGYPASNFHTENIAQFASDVDRQKGRALGSQGFCWRCPRRQGRGGIVLRWDNLKRGLV